MGSDTACKLDRVVDTYDLHGADPRHDSLSDGLLRRWRGDGEHAASGYRTLTEWFNKRLLRRVFDRHGRDALGTSVEHDYEALSGEDDLRREEVAESLAADGIDAEQLRKDMVSWGTMRTHLKNCLDGEKPRPSGSSDWERETVEMAKGFATEKVESALSSLASKGALEGFEEASVAVQIQLNCQHCPTRVPFEVALEQGYVCERHADPAGPEP